MQATKEKTHTAFSRELDTLLAKLRLGRMTKISRKIAGHDKWLTGMRYNIKSGRRISKKHYAMLLEAFPELKNVPPYPYVGRTPTGNAAMLVKRAQLKLIPEEETKEAIPFPTPAPKPSINEQILNEQRRTNQLLEQLLARWS
jgi:hypothetical protein